MCHDENKRLCFVYVLMFARDSQEYIYMCVCALDLTKALYRQQECLSRCVQKVTYMYGGSLCVYRINPVLLNVCASSCPRAFQIRNPTHTTQIILTPPDTWIPLLSFSFDIKLGTLPPPLSLSCHIHPSGVTKVNLLKFL